MSNTFPLRSLPATHIGLQPSDWIICPIISRGDSDKNCNGSKCAAWWPHAGNPSIGFCKIIERGGVL